MWANHYNFIILIFRLDITINSIRILFLEAWAEGYNFKLINFILDRSKDIILSFFIANLVRMFIILTPPFF